MADPTRDEIEHMRQRRRLGLPATSADLKCRFGCDDPIGIYHVPEGCLCWDDPVQALCWQHSDKAESPGPITLIHDLREPAA